MNRSVFKKIMENIAFAMGLNDQIPEHIRQEIIREEVSERVRNESIEEFNAAVSRNVLQQQQQLPLEEGLFSEIQGYSDLKHLLAKIGNVGSIYTCSFSWAPQLR
jgi:hypothetical protein